MSEVDKDYRNPKDLEPEKSFLLSSLLKIQQKDGRGDKIRTCDFYVPNVALYQAEPHPAKYTNRQSGAKNERTSYSACFV